MTALMRSSNWPRYFVPATMRARSSVMTFLSARISGTLPPDDFLREAFGDGGFADASFTDQHGIVFGATAKNLDDAANLVLPAHDRVHLALTGEFGQVAAKGFERGRLDLFLVFRGARCALGRSGSGFFAWSARLA